MNLDRETFEVIFQHLQTNSLNSQMVKLGENSRSCRFCKLRVTTFQNKSHAIPEFLGNKSIFTDDECDQCNAYFGNYIEPELHKFIPQGWFTRIQGKKGYARRTGINGLSIVSDSKFITIEGELPQDNLLVFKGQKFCRVRVYKSLLKILVSLTPAKYLEEFNQTIEWLMNKNSGFNELNHSPFVITGHQMPDYRLPEYLDIKLSREILEGNSIYFLVGHFNNYTLKLPYCPTSNITVRIKDIIEARNKIEEKHFELINLSNHVEKHNYQLKI